MMPMQRSDSIYVDGVFVRELKNRFLYGMFMSVIHEYPDLTVHLTLFNATIAVGEPQKLEHNDIQWMREFKLQVLPGRRGNTKEN